MKHDYDYVKDKMRKLESKIEKLIVIAIVVFVIVLWVATKGES